MNKDEILSRARQENQGVDEVKRSVEADAARLSVAVGGAVCMLLSLLESIFMETEVVSTACWIVYGSMICCKLWVYALLLKKKHYWIGAVLTTIFCAVLIAGLLLGL
jgi:hypothetical protein